MTIVDLEQLPPDDRAAIEAMVEAAYRKAPELRAKLNNEAPNAARCEGCVELRDQLREKAAWCDELERDAARYRFVRTADRVPISSEAARDPVAYDAAIDREMAKNLPLSCKTRSGCSENGCLGWCHEHRPEGPKP